jgi:hypothetical protein
LLKHKSLAQKLSVGDSDATSKGLASVWVSRAAKVMGGEPKLRSLNGIRTTGRGYNNRLEDSEDPEGPFVVEIVEEMSLREENSQSMLRETATNDAFGNHTVLKTIVTSGTLVELPSYNGQSYPGKIHKSNNEWFVLSPEGALLAALTAVDLHLDPDQQLGSALVHVVSFHWHGLPVRLFLNAHNGFVAASEIVTSDPYSVSTAAWGDIRIRMNYSNWELEPTGMHYPLQWTRTWNGKLSWTLAIYKVEIDPPVAADVFAIPAAVLSRPSTRAADDLPLGRPDRQIQELAPGVVQIPGSWYTTLVRQPDRVVVIEAPISAGYSKKVLEEAEKRFPGVPIKAVISSTNYWWHFTGLREYVARGIPVYALDQNYPQLEKFISAPHTLYPDDLARAPRAAKWHLVSERTSLGEGPNRLELIPARASTAQMMVTYFPEQRRLYTAELAQPLGPGGTFLYPHDLASVLETISENHLNVDTIIGMHMSPTPLQKLSDTVDSLLVDIRIEPNCRFELELLVHGRTLTFAPVKSGAATSLSNSRRRLRYQRQHSSTGSCAVWVYRRCNTCSRGVWPQNLHQRLQAGA